MKLSFYERKWLLKCYWKVKNVVEFQRRRRVEFGIQPPTRVTITRIRESLKSMERCKMCWKVIAEEKEVPLITSSPDLTPLHLYFWSTFKEHGVRHKTINTVRTERSDWTFHQCYSISNNPVGMLLCSTSLLGVYCGRRWTFEHVRA